VSWFRRADRRAFGGFVLRPCTCGHALITEVDVRAALVQTDESPQASRRRRREARVR
jgi:hypothetical protein